MSHLSEIGLGRPKRKGKKREEKKRPGGKAGTLGLHARPVLLLFHFLSSSLDPILDLVIYFSKFPNSDKTNKNI